MSEEKDKTNYYSAQQLTLPVRHLIHNTFDSFYDCCNSTTADLLRTKVLDESEQYILLLGPEQSGKTHLLESALSQVEQKSNRNGFFICLKELALTNQTHGSYIELFENLCIYDMLVLDNLNDWFGSCRLPLKEKETLIFNLFNMCKDKNIFLLISSACSVEELSCELPDLASRLKSGLTLRLQSYSEFEKIKILKDLAHNKGLSFNDDVASYIIKRSNRGLTPLIDILTVLDQESLTSQRKLTIPFIKKTLNW